MEREAIRAYVRRSRDAVAALKEAHWGEQFRARGPEATLRAGWALWAHARLVRPDWPTERDRADGFAHHVRLKGLLDRAADAFAGR